MGCFHYGGGVPESLHDRYLRDRTRQTITLLLTEAGERMLATAAFLR
ncbi:MAG: hypothetical protein ACAF41_11325 [Leptolyngbya sp. BL-A-14]